MVEKMSFKIEDECVYSKYTEIWNKIAKSLNTRFQSQPIYDDKNIKAKVKTFSSMINTLFSENEIPKERKNYICIAAICVDSLSKVDKKNYRQVYLEQCRYKIKKRNPVDILMLKWILIQMIQMIVFNCFVWNVFKLVNPQHKIQINGLNFKAVLMLF